MDVSGGGGGSSESMASVPSVTNAQTSSTAAGASNDPSKDPKRKAKSKDPGWKYAYWPDLNDKNKIRCTLCLRDMNQGIKRVKQHLAGGYGDVTGCPKVTPEISREMLEALLRNRKRKIENLDDDPEDDLVAPIEDEEDVQMQTPASSGPASGGSAQGTTRAVPSSGTASKKKKVVIQPQVRGPMDAHVRRTPEEVVDERRSKGSKTQTTLESRFRSAEQKKAVDNQIAAWFYECGIPFNTIKARSFQVMVEYIAQYGSGYKPPSYHDLRLPLLKTAKEKIGEVKSNYEKYWKQYGCTLMSDGWTDKRGRHLINFLVNCPEGTYFIGSVDASQHVQDANMLFELLDSKVEEIGEENVVQVVTDNASNYKAAGALLMQKRSRLYWTPCAAHCLDLMLEEIWRMSAFSGAIAKAKRITTFIYRHTRILEAMRQKTGGKDLVRAGVTRFASAFLTLKSLSKHREALRTLFVSEDWMNATLSKSEAGKKVAETVLSIQFWHTLENCIRASQPIVAVLRLVDGDERPAMAEVYVAMEEAKKRIQENFGDRDRNWKKVIKIVDTRWESQMERPLYSAALFLNPSKFFDYCEKEPDKEWSIQSTFNDVIARMVPNMILQDKVMTQATAYRLGQGTFARDSAIRQRKQMSPINWWTLNGGGSIELTKIALRILGLCCSSSGCERNWSTFEFIHTKRRNRLEHQCLNDLVYIQYNKRLQERFRERREQGRNYDPLLLDELDWSSDWMVSHQHEDVVHDDLTWAEVDRVMGASASVMGSNRPIRAQASASRGNSCYTRHLRECGSVEDELDEGTFEEDVDINDDEDLEDDFGQAAMNLSSMQQQEQHRTIDPTLVDEYDNDDE